MVHQRAESCTNPTSIQWWEKWRLSTFDLYPWGGFLPLWQHRFPQFGYINMLRGGVGGGSDIRSMSSIRPICKCRCPPLQVPSSPEMEFLNGINSSLHKTRVFVWFSTLIFLFYKILFMNWLEFSCFARTFCKLLKPEKSNYGNYTRVFG